MWVLGMFSSFKKVLMTTYSLRNTISKIEFEWAWRIAWNGCLSPPNPVGGTLLLDTVYAPMFLYDVSSYKIYLFSIKFWHSKSYILAKNLCVVHGGFCSFWQLLNQNNMIFHRFHDLCNFLIFDSQNRPFKSCENEQNPPCTTQRFLAKMYDFECQNFIENK